MSYLKIIFYGGRIMTNPSRELISRKLDEFEKHLKKIGMAKNTTIPQRMRGATEFARFLVNDPHAFNERTKGTI